MTVVQVERVVPGGLGLARDDEGVLFVPAALAGERVKVSAFRRVGGARRAQTFEIVEPSPERHDQTDCAHHPTCGGCDWLHFSPAARRESLRTMALDGLSRTAKLSEDELARVSDVRSPEEGEGRRRMRVTVSAEGALGFYQRGSSEVMPIARCAAAAPALDACLQGLIEAGPWPPGAKMRLAVDDRGHRSAAVEGMAPAAAHKLARRLVDASLVDGALVLDEEGELEFEVGDPVLLGEIAPDDEGGPYASCAASFSQATRFGARAITEEVLAAVKDREVGEGYLLELFAGAGHLTFPLARLGLDTVAIEGSARSAGWLRENMGRVPDLRIRCLWAEIDGSSFGAGLLDQLEAYPDILVADPPRTGIPRFNGILDVLAPAVLVLVSCDIATGARDIAVARKFGYRVERLTLIDAFPRTSHLEWVAVLVDDSGGESAAGGEGG